MLKEDKFEEAFKSLKGNKAPGHYDLDVNIIKSAYQLIKKPLLKIFNESVKSWHFPRKYGNSKGNTNF